jgi:hypothetical protein
MNATIAELKNQIKALTAEGAQASPAKDSSKAFLQQIEDLRREKAALEKTLADEKTSKNSPEKLPESDSEIVCQTRTTPCHPFTFSIDYPARRARQVTCRASIIAQFERQLKLH